MSRRTVISPNNADSKRTGLLKVYKAAPVVGTDGTVLIGLVAIGEAGVCEETGGAPDD
jgi:hypothetical protein